MKISNFLFLLRIALALTTLSFMLPNVEKAFAAFDRLSNPFPTASAGRFANFAPVQSNQYDRQFH